MLKILSAALWLLFTGPVMASPPPKDIPKTVAFIFLADLAGNPLVENGAPVAVGTGFFVLVENDGGPGGWGYVVTAKHVLKDANGHFFKRVFLRVNHKAEGSGFIVLDLNDSRPQQNVFIHPDPTVDIAVIPALPDQNFDFLAIPTSMIKTKDQFRAGTIQPGSDVFFSGLFVPHYGEKRNVPIFRFGRVAMLTDDRVRWQEQGKPLEMVELSLLETMSFGGNSGSPVFFSQGIDRVPGAIVVGSDEITLAGVMRGNFNEPRVGGLLQTPNAVLPTYAQNVGIAAVTPGYLLREILYSSDLQKQREATPIIQPDAPAK
ncbi:serine protease [Bradyrhizobium liaoningense]|uniref:S1 family peptidase n=1 Tax=Bradyrhizobium liaoningense TaxID=43992 RepID=UPI001BA8D647|nr:serine protease [Bradyrhizobium liaoningense]MBR0715410.1 trypsin-like peptidase domain-containing protein [Bradyrhizobium liaoningense]